MTNQNELDINEKYTLLIGRLLTISGDMGYYPAAIISKNKEESYEQRDGFKNGWNRAVNHITEAIDDIIEQVTGISDSTYKCHICKGKGYFTEEEQYVWDMLNDKPK